MALLLPFLLAACSQGEERPAAQRTDGLPTIVSLNPCTDAVLAEVAEPGQLLAISHYSQDPSSSSMPLDLARNYRVTGGTVEEVIALGPDIVVAGAFLAPATQAAFQRLGIQVETFGIVSSPAESAEQVERLARIAGNPAGGEALNARIADSLEAARWDGEAVPALLWQQGGIVAGDGALVSNLLLHAGFSSHAAARGLGQGAYVPLERVLADPPAVVIAAGGERALAHPALSAMEGTQYARLDPALTYCGGPTIIRAVEALAQIRRDVG
ncbi:ABC transporter substrate-binding protein [Paraurantiacibacter namhicola]|nr:ABC transporter substrate-binding protein [Paraurantiacibacter namhicola]